MSSVTSKGNNIETELFCEKVDTTKQHPINSIPEELLWQIFSHLDLVTLRTACCVRYQKQCVLPGKYYQKQF